MSFWDAFGRYFKAPPARPETREIAAASLTDRWSSYPSAGLTPERLTTIMQAADGGDLSEQAVLFAEMEAKDAHLASIMQTRKLSVLGLEWQVESASDEPRDQEVAAFCQEELDGLNLQEILLHLLDAVGQGYAASEIIWQTGDRWTVGRISGIPAKNVSYVNSLVPKIMSEANGWAGEEPPLFKIIYHRHRARSGHDTGNGVIRVCAWMYLLKNYALKDWAVFNEVFGMPMRLGKYDPSASPADRQALVTAIRSLGSDAAGIISKSTEIEFVEASTRLSGQYNPYQTLAEFANREMSKAVLGQTLTTDTAGATGTYAAGKVHEGVRRDLLEADAENLAATLTRQLLAPLVGFNFGWETPCPKFSFELAEEEDLKSVSETYKNLADLGFPLSLDHISERFGIPLPEKDQLTATPPPTTRQPGGGAPTAPLRAVALESQDLSGGSLPMGPGDAEVVSRQIELERLTQKALREAEPLAAQLLAPVQELITQGATLEDIRERLLAVFPQMPTEDLARLIFEMKMRAYMFAREGESQSGRAI